MHKGQSESLFKWSLRDGSIGDISGCDAGGGCGGGGGGDGDDPFTSSARSVIANDYFSVPRVTWCILL